MKLTDMQVKEFINVLASDAPAPGGGSASALAGAMGVGLAKMVASLTLGKAKYAEHQKTVQQIHDRANKLVSQLTAGIDRDTEAFDGVSAVFRRRKSCPQGSHAEGAEGSDSGSLFDHGAVPGIAEGDRDGSGMHQHQRCQRFGRCLPQPEIRRTGRMAQRAHQPGRHP